MSSRTSIRSDSDGYPEAVYYTYVYLVTPVYVEEVYEPTVTIATYVYPVVETQSSSESTSRLNPVITVLPVTTEVDESVSVSVSQSVLIPIETQSSSAIFTGLSPLFTTSSVFSEEVYEPTVTIATYVYPVVEVMQNGSEVIRLSPSPVLDTTNVESIETIEIQVSKPMYLEKEVHINNQSTDELAVLHSFDEFYTETEDTVTLTVQPEQSVIVEREVFTVINETKTDSDMQTIQSLFLGSGSDTMFQGSSQGSLGIREKTAVLRSLSTVFDDPDLKNMIDSWVNKLDLLDSFVLAGKQRSFDAIRHNPIFVTYVRLLELKYHSSPEVYQSIIDQLGLRGYEGAVSKVLRGESLSNEDMAILETLALNSDLSSLLAHKSGNVLNPPGCTVRASQLTPGARTDTPIYICNDWDTYSSKLLEYLSSGGDPSKLSARWDIQLSYVASELFRKIDVVSNTFQSVQNKVHSFLKNKGLEKYSPITDALLGFAYSLGLTSLAVATAPFGGIPLGLILVGTVGLPLINTASQLKLSFDTELEKKILEQALKENWESIVASIGGAVAGGVSGAMLSSRILNSMASISARMGYTNLASKYRGALYKLNAVISGEKPEFSFYIVKDPVDESFKLVIGKKTTGELITYEDPISISKSFQKILAQSGDLNEASRILSNIQKISSSDKEFVDTLMSLQRIVDKIDESGLVPSTNIYRILSNLVENLAKDSSKQYRALIVDKDTVIKPFGRGVILSKSDNNVLKVSVVSDEAFYNFAVDTQTMRDILVIDHLSKYGFKDPQSTLSQALLNVGQEVRNVDARFSLVFDGTTLKILDKNSGLVYDLVDQIPDKKAFLDSISRTMQLLSSDTFKKYPELYNYIREVASSKGFLPSRTVDVTGLAEKPSVNVSEIMDATRSVLSGIASKERGMISSDVISLDLGSRKGLIVQYNRAVFPDKDVFVEYMRASSVSRDSFVKMLLNKLRNDRVIGKVEEHEFLELTLPKPVLDELMMSMKTKPAIEFNDVVQAIDDAVLKGGLSRSVALQLKEQINSVVSSPNTIPIYQMYDPSSGSLLIGLVVPISVVSSIFKTTEEPAQPTMNQLFFSEPIVLTEELPITITAPMIESFFPVETLIEQKVVTPFSTQISMSTELLIDEQPSLITIPRIESFLIERETAGELKLPLSPSLEIGEVFLLEDHPVSTILRPIIFSITETPSIQRVIEPLSVVDQEESILDVKEETSVIPISSPGYIEQLYADTEKLSIPVVEIVNTKVISLSEPVITPVPMGYDVGFVPTITRPPLYGLPTTEFIPYGKEVNASKMEEVIKL